MATLSSVSLLMSQMEPSLPCALTAAFRMITFSLGLPPLGPAMPHLAVMFIVQSSMVRVVELMMYMPHSFALAMLREPNPLMVVDALISRVGVDPVPVILLLPLSSIVRSRMA